MNRYLTSGRGIRPDSPTEVIGFLKKLEIWAEYRQAYEKLKPPVAHAVKRRLDG